MTNYYSIVKITVQTKSKKKISFSLDELTNWAESVNISLVDNVDCTTNKMLACTSVNELCELIINSVDWHELMEMYEYDDEITNIVLDKTKKFTEKMQTIDNLSDISCIMIEEETNATGEYAVEIAPQWCDEKLSVDIIEQACDNSEEFEKIEKMIYHDEELSAFNAIIVTTVYLDGGKTKAKWMIDAETAYAEDGFTLKNNITKKKNAVEVESWDVFDNIDRNDSRWTEWVNWALRELSDYNERLKEKINLDFATFSEMMRSVPPGSENRKLMLDYPYVFLKAEEGDELACRFASIYRDISDIF